MQQAVDGQVMSAAWCLSVVHVLPKQQMWSECTIQHTAAYSCAWRRLRLQRSVICSGGGVFKGGQVTQAGGVQVRVCRQRSWRKCAN
jgi:hypothetical protein